jgi:hypothetical protein
VVLHHHLEFIAHTPITYLTVLPSRIPARSSLNFLAGAGVAAKWTHFWNLHYTVPYESSERGYAIMHIFQQNA